MAEISNADFLRQFANNKAGRSTLLGRVILPLERPLIAVQLRLLEEKRGALIEERADTPLRSLGSNDLRLRGVDQDRTKFEGLLRRSVVGYPEPDEDKITIGSLVGIMQGDRESSLAVVGSSTLHDGLADGIRPASIDAPLVRQLIGHQVGQVVIVELNDVSREVAITAIDQRAMQQRDPNPVASL